MNPVLESIKPVVKKSKHVKINKENLKYVCSKFSREERCWMNESHFDLSGLSLEEKLNFIFVFNSVNFCYWGDPKWTIKYKGKQYDGALGMKASLLKALDNGIPILNAKYLATLKREELSEILKGNVAIPLFEERLKILRENGRILAEKYKGEFSLVIERANKDALKLLEILPRDFPSFNDYAFYEGRKVLFHKRVQLAIADVYRAFKGESYGNLKNVDKLTAFADYKLPQILRKFGILEYSKELASKIDNKIQIPANSKEEIEIRANTIYAIELMKRELETWIPNITSMDIDSYLWLLGQRKSSNDKPYHRTLTIFY